METKAHIAKRTGLYEKIIRLYPPSYARKHREELLQNFADLERDIGSRKAFWAFVMSDFIKSLSLEYMEYIKRNRWAQIALAIIVFLGALFVWQVLSLQKAHSTFDNYAAFRGCEKITSQTDTYGTCITNSGQSIKIVRYDNRWFLDGDLPVCAVGVGSICFVHWP